MIDFLGTRIQNAREKKGLSAKHIAQRVGVAPSTWSLYENDKRQPSIETLIIIAKELEVTTDYLLGLEKSKK